MSLRTRILLLVMLATLMPAVVVGLYEVERRDSEIAEAKRDLSSLATYVVNNLDDKVKSTVQLLHALSNVPGFDARNKSSCSAFLAEVLAHNPQYTGVLTITPDGDLHCDSLNTGRQLNVGARDYFRQTRATLQPAFDIVFGGLTGIAVLQVAYPVLDAGGELRFVLLASLNISQYTREISAASRFQEIHIAIWDRNGMLMVRKPDTGSTGLVGKKFTTSALFRFAASATGGAAAEVSDLDGVARFWALGVPPGNRDGGMRIMLGISKDALLDKANTGLQTALLLLISISIFAFAFAWLIAELSIRRPAKRIINSVRKFSAGDLDTRIGTPYPRGELGELMAAIDHTAEAVQAQQSDLEATGRKLQRTNRTLTVLSGVNTLIARAHERNMLFSEACRIAVEDGGFRMSMIGMIDQHTKKVVPVATAGKDEALLIAIKNILSSSEQAPKTMVARAIREKKAVVSNNSQSDSGVVFDRQYAASGVHSMAVVPLILANDAIGVFALYSRERDFFQEQEMKLLTSLADNISFAIDHIEKQERLEYIAYFDPLTGLANRNKFLNRLTQYLRKAASGGYQLAVYMIDLEGFKNINDNLGQPSGDVLLQLVAEWLTGNAGDVRLLARLGADHFAAVLPQVRQEDKLVRHIENTLDRFLKHPFHVNKVTLRIAAKVGVALFPTDGTNADTLFRNAEAALKKAKAGGERYLFYTPAMNKHGAERLTLENQLRQALDNGEFVLHYQPKANLASGKLTGVEALIRWDDPRTGLVPPDRFIPILEETGLIHDVGRWALHQAIADYLRWSAAGLAVVRIAVNVSPLQLRNPGFVEEIRQKISIDTHAAGGLELEITESLIMADVTHSINSLTAIRAMGVTIAIDDFGTGFSSLSYLSKLPVDTLKIDRSFVSDMTSGPDGMALVSAIINLAHAMKLTVVAEGVETDEQARLLRLLMCDEMQGYLFSKPVPVDIFESRFLARPAPGNTLG